MTTRAATKKRPAETAPAVSGKLAAKETSETRVFADLKRLGFTEYEARVYVELLRESPIRYVAAEPRGLLDAISRQTSALCADLGAALATLAPRADDQYVWALRGDDAVHDKVDALIAGSREAIWVKAADDVLRRHKASLREAAKRGVSLLIVLFGSDAEEFRFSRETRVYIHEANGVRMGSADNLFTLAIDHVEMLTAAMEGPKEGGEVVAAHTRNRPIVTLAVSLVRHD